MDFETFSVKWFEEEIGKIVSPASAATLAKDRGVTLSSDATARLLGAWREHKTSAGEHDKGKRSW